MNSKSILYVIAFTLICSGCSTYYPVLDKSAPSAYLEFSLENSTVDAAASFFRVKENTRCSTNNVLVGQQELSTIATANGPYNMHPHNEEGLRVSPDDSFLLYIRNVSRSGRSWCDTLMKFKVKINKQYVVHSIRTKNFCDGYVVTDENNRQKPVELISKETCH